MSTGRLTDKYMDQLEQWIGKGPKQFNLIYNITSDGCNSTTFHQKCDNQGPTVTVLYNPQGSIYGGYTALSWDQSGAWGNDPSAFLFRLQYNGKEAGNKFPCVTPANAMYNNRSNGPVFGANYDLYAFGNTVNASGGYYTLNGSLQMGINNNYYNYNGIPSSQINNDSMQVTELEVYRVIDGKRTRKVKKPLRDTPEWNMTFLESLFMDVQDFAPPQIVQVPQSNILILGPVGAGKSSFFNTIASVFRGHVTRQASSGNAEHSITSKVRIAEVHSLKSEKNKLFVFDGQQSIINLANKTFEKVTKKNWKMYQVRRSASEKPLNFRLCDTQGLEESQGIDAHDVAYILDGNVPDGYQFNPSVPISSDIPGFKKNTQLKDQIHCVCIVIDGSTAGVLSDKLLEKIKAIQMKVHQKSIPQLLLMTKVDKICPEVEEDTSKVFKSEAVIEQVNKVSQLLGIPRNSVLPVKNYETEIEVNDSFNILALITLRQILRASEDFMYNFIDEVESHSDETSGATARKLKAVSLKN